MKKKVLIIAGICCLIACVGMITFALGRYGNSVSESEQNEVVRNFWIAASKGEDTRSFTLPYEAFGAEASEPCKNSNADAKNPIAKPVAVSEPEIARKLAKADLIQFESEIRKFEFTLLSIQTYWSKGENSLLKVTYSIPEASKITIESYLRLTKSDGGWKIVRHEYARRDSNEWKHNPNCSDSAD